MVKQSDNAVKTFFKDFFLGKKMMWLLISKFELYAIIIFHVFVPKNLLILIFLKDAVMLTVLGYWQFEKIILSGKWGNGQ